MMSPEVTTYRPNRPPARSFAELAGTGAAPVEAPAEEPEAVAVADLKLDPRDAATLRFIDAIKAEVDARLGMIEARVEKLDTIVESLETLIDEAPKAKGDESLVHRLVRATVTDCLLPPMAALHIMAQELGLACKPPTQWARDPATLPRELSNASPMAVKMAMGIDDEREAPTPPKKRGPKPKPKPNRKAKATGDGVPTPAIFLERLTAAGGSQRDVAEKAGVHQTQVSRFVRGHTVPAISRARMWAALERLEQGGAKKPKKGATT